MALAQPQPVAASSLNRRPVTLAVIVGNRGFFPHHLALSGRNTILEILEKAGINAIITPETDTNVGAIESLEEARLCAELFRQHRDDIDGVLVTLPNFGDERAIANTLRFADLNVPVLIHTAEPQEFFQPFDFQNERWPYLAAAAVVGATVLSIVLMAMAVLPPPGYAVDAATGLPVEARMRCTTG